MEEFFKDLVIVELAGILAGPSAGMFFAELGAKVFKVENSKGSGDMTRTWRGPDESSTGPSAYFAAANYKKNLIKADLKNELERDLIYQLIKKADVVLVNYKSGDAEKLGMSFHNLTKINPTLIYAAVKGYEYSDKPAFDVVLQAESAFMDMNGTEESGPLKMPLAMIDVLTAHQLKEAILLALLKREKTGKGSEIEVSLEKSALSALINQASNYLMNGKIPQRLGSLHPNIAPYGDIFYCKDEKSIVTAIGSDKHFTSFCSIINGAELAEDEKFITNPKRISNRKKLQKALQEKIGKVNSEDLLNSCEELNVPVGLIKNMQQVLAGKAAQEMVREEMIEGRLTKRLSSLGFDTDFLKN